MGLLDIDFYKAGHIFQYPEGTSFVYSNFTPRSTKYLNVNREFWDGKVVFFGLQDYIRSDLYKTWNLEFFSQDKQTVVQEYKNLMEEALGADFNVEHIEALHDLGYLPIEIKALKEGSSVNPGIPVFTIHNTIDDFFWVTNYLETSISAAVWKLMVNATVAKNYRSIFANWQEKTGAPVEFVDFQGHDFSSRGMSGMKDGEISGTAHLTSFKGTDSVKSIQRVKKIYNCNDFIGGSVPATEHSVMCMGGDTSELETITRLITEVYPKGIVSIVADTWDFWKVISVTAKTLKETILKREGKVVFRPDSGDPVKIITGDQYAEVGSLENKGAVQVLWDLFGGTVNDEGFKNIDTHVGLIYGDSITPERANEILKRLHDAGFASDNIVFGIGSYTYNYSTRDSIGAAMKATYGIIDGKPCNIFKNPKTDNGTKKSAKGLLRVILEDDEFKLLQEQPTHENSELKTVFKNGIATDLQTFTDIRNRILKG